MRLQTVRPKREIEGTIAFINIVFLILIFLLIAGTLTGFDAPRVDPARAQDAELGPAPHDAVVLRADGSVNWRGREFDVAGIRETMRQEAALGMSRVRVYADHDASASAAIDLVAVIRASGVKNVFFVTVREQST